MCKKQPKTCSDPEFIAQFCKLFPLLSMKLVRLPLYKVKNLLLKTNVKILYLVRDPRAVMASRLKRKWCKISETCKNPAILCAQLQEDFKSAQRLLQLFPSQVLIMRYEDITHNINMSVSEIFNFAGRDLNSYITNYIRTHTVGRKGGVYQTYRDTAKIAKDWLNKLTLNQIQLIQEQCKDAMKLWGYNFLDSNTNKQYFNQLRQLEMNKQ